MSDLVAVLVRVTAFARKEVTDVLRQPRLVATLILGPFAILALFGLGYQRDTGPMRAVLVVPDGTAAPFQRELEARLSEFGDSITLIDTVSDESPATEQVRNGRADIAIIAPADPYAAVRNGDQAVFEVLHDTLDPFEQATIRLVAKAAIDSVNRELLSEVIATGQNESAEVVPLIEASQETASLLRQTLDAGDVAGARAHRVRLEQQLAQIEQVVGPTAVLGRSLGSQLGDDAVTSKLGLALTELHARVGSLDLESADRATSEQIAELRSVEADLDEMSRALADFRRIEPDVLVSPLDVDTELVGSVAVDVTDFYAPGVIALLLQHLAITFASLSLVRERALGTTEVFRVTPLGATSILAGKYIGYTLGASVVGSALSLLLLVAFRVPIAGSRWDYIAVQLLLILAALGVGFLISSFVTSDTQAVNVAMIVLLLSIFFSGFFLPLDRLLAEVRIVSWMLPITHALDSLRDIMFRGVGVDLRTWVALGAGSVALYAVSWWALRRRLRPA